MIVNLSEVKNYLRIDFEDDDALLLSLIQTAEQLCASVARMDVDSLSSVGGENIHTAVLYTVAYLYEHREEADHHELTITLRSLLFGIRKEGF